MSNQEVRPLVEYLDSPEYEVDGQLCLTFELSDGTQKNIERGYQALEEGKADVARNSLINALIETMELGNVVFYKKTMVLLKPGFVARKVVDTGYSTLDKDRPSYS